MKHFAVLLIALAPSCAALDALAGDPVASDSAAVTAGQTVEDTAGMVGVPAPLAAGAGALVTLVAQQGLAWRRRRLAAAVKA